MSQWPIRTFGDVSNDVIVVDGLWGSGKQLVSTLVGGFDRVEHFKYNPDYDYLCAASHLHAMWWPVVRAQFVHRILGTAPIRNPARSCGT